MGIYKEKARESVLVARPATQGLRIAQLASTSNADSPRRYVQHNSTQFLMKNVLKIYKHIPQTSTVALLLASFQSLRSFE